jgi:ribosomal protein L11 methyltransferase
MVHQPSHRDPTIPLGRGGQWLELSITVPASRAEDLAQALVALGSPGVVEETVRRGGRAEDGRASMLAKLVAAFPLEQATERLLDEVRRRIDALGPEVGAQATLAMQLTHGDAWIEQWQRFYRPFKVGRRLIIRPPWEPYAAAPDEIVLTLNPGQAFGTGLHATTQLCLDLLDQQAALRPGAMLLDVGCGSGILSLAAVLGGFGAAVGLDLDRVAVRVARINARLNHLSKRVTFAVGSLEAVARRFEVVVANILLEPILAMLKPLQTVLTPGGVLILGGILSVEVRQLQRGLSKHGWRITRQVSREDWVAVACESVKRSEDGATVLRAT